MQVNGWEIIAMVADDGLLLNAGCKQCMLAVDGNAGIQEFFSGQMPLLSPIQQRKRK